MKPSVHFYRLGEPGLVLVWRPDATAGALLLASAGSFAPDTLLAELPAGRRFALVPEYGDARRRLYWRTADGEHGSAGFTGQPPPDAGGDANWETCTVTRRSIRTEDGSATVGFAAREGLRACCRPEAGGERGALEWTDAVAPSPPRAAPHLQAFFAFRNFIPERDRRPGADIHGDLRVRLVPNAGMKESVRVWIDRLHPQDLTPEKMSGYSGDAYGWSSEEADEWAVPSGTKTKAEWSVTPGCEMPLKFPRLIEAPTFFRPARHAVDERDILIVRTWPEVEVQTFIVPPRVEDSDEKRPEPFAVSAVEYVAGNLVAPEPGRALVESMQKHWEQRRAELTLELAQDEWGGLPTEVRLFLAGYRRWLPDWPPERLTAILREDRIFRTLSHLPTGIGARLIEEAADSAQQMAQAAGSADADRRVAAFIDNPGLFHAVADDPGFAGTLAQTAPAAPPPRPFTAVRWLAGRLPTDPRMDAALRATSGKTALHYLAALAGNLPADVVTELLCTGFVPAGREEIAPAGKLLERLRLATDLFGPGTDVELVARAPQTPTIRALRRSLDRGGYRLAELEQWVQAAEAARAQYAGWYAVATRESGRRQLVAEICAALSLPEPVEPAALQQALESVVAGAPALPEATDELGRRVEAGRRRLAALSETWQKRERDTRGDGADDGLEPFLKSFGANVATLAYREVAGGAEGNLRDDLERLAGHASILGPMAAKELTPFVQQAHASLTHSPPDFFGLPALQAALHARIEAVLPPALEIHAAAARLLAAATALAAAMPGHWQLPPFENAEQYAEDFAQRRPAFQAELERAWAQAREAASALGALAGITRTEAPSLPAATLPAWPRPEAGTAQWAGALADCAGALPALLATVDDARKSLCAQMETGSWPHAQSVVDALRSGHYADALETARQAPLRAQLEAARDEAARLLVPSGEAAALLAITPPLVSGGEDLGWFDRSRELLGASGPEANAAAMASRLAALTALREEILHHDAGKPQSCRSILLGACRVRCKLAHERLNQNVDALTPELRALAEVSFERWSPAELQAAEQHL